MKKELGKEQMKKEYNRSQGGKKYVKRRKETNKIGKRDRKK
jgi:hypothetical protein